MGLLELRTATLSRIYWGGSLLCLFGLVWCLLAFYPGFFTNDSINQWQYAKGYWEMNDWHPPLMSFVWGKLMHFTPNVSGMFLLDAAMFWLGLFLIFLASVPESLYPVACLTVPLVGMLPFSMRLIGMVWKDVSMGAALMLGFGLSFFGQTQGRRWLCLLSLPFLFYGMAVRHNALLAVIPLLYFLSPAFAAVTRKARVLASTLLVALFLMANYVTGVELKTAHTYPYQYQMLADLGYVSVAIGRPLFPAYITREPRFNFSEFQRRFNFIEFDTIFWESNSMLKRTADPQEIQELTRSWRQMIANHLSAYLGPRAGYYLDFLSLNFRQPVYDLAFGNSEAQFQDSALTEPTKEFLRFFDGGVLFRAGYWLLGSLFMLAYAARRRPATLRERAAVALHASSVVYAAGYFVVSPFGPFRYLWWCVIASAVAFAIGLTGLKSRLA